MPHSNKIDYTQCINCSQRDGPLYCHQCVVCDQWIPLAITGSGWLPPLRRTIITRCAICTHWVCGYCGNFTVGSERQAGEYAWFATQARACGHPCTSLAQKGNFEMPQTMLKDWNARDFGSTRQILLDKHWREIIIMWSNPLLLLQSKAASKAPPATAGAFHTPHGSVKDPQLTQKPVDSSIVWDQLADKLARRAFVVLKIPTKGEAKRIKDMKDNFREILAQEFTPQKEPDRINFPPSVLELLADKKRKLLHEEQNRIDASNSALRGATNFAKLSLRPLTMVRGA